MTHARRRAPEIQKGSDMRSFQYAGMPKVYFGEGSLKAALEKELAGAGENVLLAYGGGSVKKTGIYDQAVDLLHALGKTVFDFSGIMANPTYAKVQEGAAFIREIGLPSTFTELKAGMREGSPDPTDPEILWKVADTAIITPGCARQLGRDELYQILTECI